MPIDTLTGKNWQFPLRIVYLKHEKHTKETYSSIFSLLWLASKGLGEKYGNRTTRTTSKTTRITFPGQLGPIFSVKSNPFLSQIWPLCKDNSEHVLRTTRITFLTTYNTQLELIPYHLMPIDTLTGKNWQFPLIIVYLKHDFIQLYLFFRQISKNYYMYVEKKPHNIFFWPLCKDNSEHVLRTTRITFVTTYNTQLEPFYTITCTLFCLFVCSFCFAWSVT
jgi:hypothetical protein